MDLYEVLEVSPSAEPEVIEGAYKRLAYKYHPDRNHSPGASARLRDLNAAYEVLGDPQRRAAYDRERARQHDAERQRAREAQARQEHAKQGSRTHVPPREGSSAPKKPSKPKRRCAKCEKRNELGAPVCQRCGAAMAGKGEVLCTACPAVFEDWRAECPKCGVPHARRQPASSAGKRQASSVFGMIFLGLVAYSGVTWAPIPGAPGR